MAKKYYAVKKGLVPGIYVSWPECKPNINGFSGAEYRSFGTRKEAQAYLDGKNETASEDDENISRIYSDTEATAYIDGSYNSATGEYGYGLVMFYNGGEEHLAGKFSDPDMASMTNIAGEIEGAKAAMKFCVDNGIKSLELFYDCQGIKEWCTGEFKTNKPGTKEYRKYYNSVKNSVVINFIKVKSHSGNMYNDLADALAKSAIGVGEEGVPVSIRDNGVVANGIKEDALLAILELLKEDFQDFQLKESEIPYGYKYELTIESPNKQKVTLNYYKGKEKVWVTGRREDLFNRFSLYIIELLEVDAIPDFLNTVHDLNIDKDIVQTEFEALFPNSYDKIPTDLNNYLHQAVYNLQISGKVYVANFLVEPAIRPLEGILKMALVNNGFPIRKEDKTYDSFFIFKEVDNKYVVRKEYITGAHSRRLIDYLGKAYTYYYNNRHSLFHWDNPTEERDTTRIINTVEEASVIIRDVIALIDEYFTI